MGMFNYKNYNTAHVTYLVSSSYKLAIYATQERFLDWAVFWHLNYLLSIQTKLITLLMLLMKAGVILQWKNSGYLRNMSIQEVFIAFPVRLQETLRQDLVLS